MNSFYLVICLPTGIFIPREKAMYFQRRVKMKKVIMVSVERGGSAVGMISGSFFLPLSCF